MGERPRDQSSLPGFNRVGGRSARAIFRPGTRLARMSEDDDMNTAIRNTILTIIAVVLALWTAGSCPAMDQPPQEPDQLRAWLVGHLVTDMEALGTFDGTTLAKVPGIVNALTDDQVALLAQYYFLTRSKTEQDASLYALQQQGYADEQVNEAKAEIADLLTEMQNQGDACYSQIRRLGEPVQYLAQICYASVPGWCCHARCYVPEWYYDNGCYVGPCYNAAYAGTWGVPVCNAYYDHGSRFYATYHNVPNRSTSNHSIKLGEAARRLVPAPRRLEERHGARPAGASLAQRLPQPAAPDRRWWKAPRRQPCCGSP